MTPDDYIAVLEESGINLLEYQKILLLNLINSNNFRWLIPTRGDGRSTTKALAILYKLCFDLF